MCSFPTHTLISSIFKYKASSIEFPEIWQLVTLLQIKQKSGRLGWTYCSAQQRGRPAPASMSRCQEVAFAGQQMSVVQACPCSGHTTQILSSYFSFDAGTANSFSPAQLLQMSRQLIYWLACICRIAGKRIIRVIHDNPCVGVCWGFQRDGVKYLFLQAFMVYSLSSKSLTLILPCTFRQHFQTRGSESCCGHFKDDENWAHSSPLWSWGGSPGLSSFNVSLLDSAKCACYPWICLFIAQWTEVLIKIDFVATVLSLLLTSFNSFKNKQGESKQFSYLYAVHGC